MSSTIPQTLKLIFLKSFSKFIQDLYQWVQVTIYVRFLKKKFLLKLSAQKFDFDMQICRAACCFTQEVRI